MFFALRTVAGQFISETDEKRVLNALWTVAAFRSSFGRSNDPRPQSPGRDDTGQNQSGSNSPNGFVS